MTTVFAIVLPIFGLIALGVIGGKSRLFPESAVDGLNNFVLYVAVPALLFRTIVRAQPLENLNLDVAYAYYLGSFAVLGAALLFGRGVFKLRDGEQASFAMGTMFANTSLLGIPIVFATFGEAGLVPLMVIITFHSLVFSTIFFTLHDLGKAGDGKAGSVGWAGTARLAGRSIVTNPVIIAIFVGFVWSVLGLGLPGPVSTIIDMLAEATIPAALFALGAVLAGFKVAGNIPQAATMATAKLIAHPLVVFVAARYLFGLSDLELAVVTITAALPGGMMVFLIAQSYGVYVARAASSLVIGTAGALITVSVLLAWFA
ncbi:MAG: AEC family transporter [Alphaproteobacteria bacterium]